MKKGTLSQILLNSFFVLVCLAYILPFILVISISISSETAIDMYGYSLLPKVIDFAAYKQIFSNPTQLVNSYQTTIIFSLLTMVLSVLVMALLAYPLSRSNYKLKGVLTFYIFFTMLFGGGLVPSYIINTKYFHLDNTIWIYILPALVNAWNVIIMRTFFQGIPGSLVESAKVDGASELRIFFQIMMPLSKPVLATMAFMVVIAKWNDWNTALIYIRKADLYSLQYMLQKILREADFVEKMAQETGQLSGYKIPTESMRYAMAILAAGPVLLVFPFFQKYFTKGLTIGAVKG